MFQSNNRQSYNFSEEIPSEISSETNKNKSLKWVKPKVKCERSEFTRLSQEDNQADFSAEKSLHNISGISDQRLNWGHPEFLKKQKSCQIQVSTSQ